MNKLHLRYNTYIEPTMHKATAQMLYKYEFI